MGQALCWLLLFQVYELPFIVVLDHRKEAVVVAVRGTMSFQVVPPCWAGSDLGTVGEQRVSHGWVLGQRKFSLETEKATV